LPIVKQINGLKAEITHDSTGQLTIHLTTEVLKPMEDDHFNAVVNELVGAVHDVLIIWGLL
jgi:hypothetical protein